MPIGRRPLLAGNWKMNGSRAAAEGLLAAAIRAGEEHPDRDVLVAPPYTLLETAARTLKGSRVLLAGQDVYWEAEGAFTGEVSAAMLREVGCSHVIVGHSERRQHFGETDETVNRKVRAGLANGLTPIMCVGETLAEREKGETAAVVERQLRAGLSGMTAADVAKAVIAYEPVWAIGTGKVATPAQAQEVHARIRGLIKELSNAHVAASQCRILYGGSVKADNVDALMREADVDGALVGGASLQAEAFARIVAFQR